MLFCPGSKHIPSVPCTSSVLVPLSAQRQRCLSQAWLSCSLQDSAHLTPDLPQAPLVAAGLPRWICQHSSFLPCKTSAISDHSCLQLPQVSLLHPSCSCCQLYRPYGASAAWPGDTLAWAQGLPTWDWQGGEIWAVMSNYIFPWVTFVSITQFLLFDFVILILISFFDSFSFRSFLQGVTWFTFSICLLCSVRQEGSFVHGK